MDKDATRFLQLVDNGIQWRKKSQQFEAQYKAAMEAAHKKNQEVCLSLLPSYLLLTPS
jgi:multidrug resistance efflux pump